MFVFLVLLYFIIIKIDFNNVIFKITILLPLSLIVVFQIVKFYKEYKNRIK